VDADPAGNYIALVVRLQLADDGLWYLYVDGTVGPQAVPLSPATLIIRLWRNGDTGVLRGSVRFQDSDLVAPIQTGAQIESLIRAWLSPGGTPPGVQ
jgi:hypothetical protein